MSVIIYAVVSVIIVSLISLIGILTLSSKKNWNKYLLILVSLSAGTLFGGAFLHLLPEAVEMNGFSLQVSLLLLLGVLIFFLLEKFVHWHHCHDEGHAGSPHHKKEIAKHATNKAVAPLNLAGDALHNFLDGLIIAGSYLVSIPAGIATTVAVIFHEIPQEIADFGVLLYSGMSKGKAIMYNFGSAAFAIVGTVIGLVLGAKSQAFVHFILPIAAGGFVYIAGSNLIPELHKDCELTNSFWHFVAMVVGIALMVALVFIG